MKQILKVEWIGFGANQALLGYNKLFEGMGLIHSDEDKHKSNKPWVAQITGACPRFKLKRKFVTGQADFADSSKNGNRGVMMTFILESGCVYECNYKTSWRGTSRYFCTVTDGGQIVTVDDSEVEQWLKNM